MNGWIDAKVEKPRPYTDVLCTNGRYYFIGQTDEYGIWFDDFYRSKIPTHWMYLPEMPEKEK